MTPRAALDWLFYLTCRHWALVTMGKAYPADAAEAFWSVADRLEPLGPLHTTGTERRSPHLMLLGADDLELLAGHPAYLDGTTVDCLAVFCPARPGRRRPRPLDDLCVPGFRTLALTRARLASDRMAYFPSSLGSARRYAWLALANPQSPAGQAARVGLEASGISFSSLTREDTLVLHCRGDLLHPMATRLLLLSAGQTDSNPVIGYEFPPGPSGGRAVPERIVKLPRVQDRTATLRREQSRMAQICTLLPGGKIRPLGRVQWDAETVGWSQAAVAGSSLNRSPFPARLTAAWRLASWFQDLERATTRAVVGGRMRPPDVRRWSASISTAASTMLPLTQTELAYVREAPRHLADSGVRLTFCHLDAGPWNILVDKGLPCLIDWESAGWGLPGSDMVYLLTHLTFNSRKAHSAADQIDTFVTTFLTPEGRPVWLAEAIARLSRWVGLEGDGLYHRLAFILLRIAVRWECLSRSARGKQVVSSRFFEMWRELVAAGPSAWTHVECRQTYDSLP